MFTFAEILTLKLGRHWGEMAGTPGRENHHQAYASTVSRDARISELECDGQIMKSLWDME